ncbi:MAG: ATP-dependent DNA helicase RecG [Campylobacterales bacterium]|nr:ATP-dependent DNA helicase RecG [Campylobacterales bacterium]
MIAIQNSQIFHHEDKEKLKKLSVQNLLDLALIVPNSYENLFESFDLIPNSEIVVKATILDIEKTPKYLKLRLFLERFNKDIFGIIFNYQSYMLKTFEINKTLFLKGKLEFNYQTYTIIQPKVVSEINTILINYKTSIQSRGVRLLMQKYLKIEILEQILKDKNVAKAIFEIHNPNMKSLQNYLKEKNFSKEQLFALKYVEIFNYLTKLKSKKTVHEANFQIKCSNIEPFLNTLPFKLTNDQLKAIDDIKNDISKQTSAKRVIVGDVGCGKSMVILATAFLAKSHKSILMVPTSILANQLFSEAKKYLSSFLKVAIVTQKECSEDFFEADFIIGTHALLYKELPKVGVVMIDEQHRFGSNQRHLLEKLGSIDNKKPHFFQFSATPIPRTMSLIDSKLADFSFIKQIPYKKDITTTVISKEHFQSLIKHIKSEISKNNQVAIIYPLVEQSDNLNYQSIEEGKSYWLKHFENVYITHGKDKEKEKILEEFRDNGNILIATTVVEVGISLDRLSTIIIVGAERLGLATLHQLRGRVSRTGLKGYCFLYTNILNSKRLLEFSQIVDGFEIAELDLKYRNSGDLLSGKIQSGKSFRFFEIAEDGDILEMVNFKV